MSKDETDRAAGKAQTDKPPETVTPAAAEKGGPKGPEPTRYGDWEVKGIVSDF